MFKENLVKEVHKFTSPILADANPNQASYDFGIHRSYGEEAKK